MEQTALRTSLVGRWIGVGAGVLGGLALGPVLADVVAALLTAADVYSAVYELALVLFLPMLLGFVVAEVGGGLLAGWLASVPYFVAVQRELACRTSGLESTVLCARPSVGEALPFAVGVALLAVTIGYAPSAIAAWRHDDPPVWISAGYFVAAVAVVSVGSVAFVAVHRIVPWHPILDAFLFGVGW